MLTRLTRRPVVSLCRFMSTSRPQPGVAASSLSGSSTAKMGASEQQQQQQQGPGVTGNAGATAASDSTAASTQQQQQQQQAPGGNGMLPLPAPPPQEEQMNQEAAGRGDDVMSLRVGESLRLDALGPLVVNKDGSMARVGNWTGMTEMEREATLRLLGKRNSQRLAALKARQDAAEQVNRNGTNANR